jgi:hypothetical protein
MNQMRASVMLDKEKSLNRAIFLMVGKEGLEPSESVVHCVTQRSEVGVIKAKYANSA